MQRPMMMLLKVGLATTVFAILGLADSERQAFRARLTGFQEAPSAISTAASGQFRAKLSADGGALEFEMEYEGLQADALFSHVHLGPVHQSGGIMFFICGGGSKPTPCPLRAGTVSGTVTQADVIGPTGQGISAGEFAEALRAMRSGAAYVNVHSTLFPGGEIRGQIGGDGRDRDNDQ